MVCSQQETGHPLHQQRGVAILMASTEDPFSVERVCGGHLQKVGGGRDSGEARRFGGGSGLPSLVYCVDAVILAVKFNKEVSALRSRYAAP